jgi:hypothetical protein
MPPRKEAALRYKLLARSQQGLDGQTIDSETDEVALSVAQTKSYWTEGVTVSDDMKEGPTLSSMGEIETIYEGGWDHDLHRIRSPQELDAGRGHRRSGKIIREMRVLNDSSSLKNVAIPKSGRTADG